MELYDKKFVYFEWSDKLEGKDVFCATSIEDLKSQVNYGNAQTGVLHHSNNPKGHPFVPTWSDGSGSLAFPFAYYDPNYEVKKAYFKDGKKLQWKYRNEEDWNDWDNDSCPTFSDNTTGYELRVKPEDIDYDTGVINDKVLPKPLTEESDYCEIYNKNGEMKSYSKEAVEYARNRVNYELSYICGMDFTDEQIKWIKDHIYTSVRKAYQSAVDKWSGNEGDRIYRIDSKVEEPEKDRYLANKELAMWLAQGKGLAMDKGKGRKSTSYDYWEEDKTVDYLNIRVRKWGDDDWHKPTHNYCFGDK